MEENSEILRKFQKVPKQTELNFYKLRNTESFVTCFGRPSLKQLANFKNNYKINIILTLQGLDEKPEEIHKACDENGIEWLHFPEMGAGKFTLIKIKEKLVEFYIYLFKRMQSEQIRLFVHCAAGVHRTGVFLYGLIRLSGENEENSYSLLKDIRHTTYLNVGKERIGAFEKEISGGLLKKFYGEKFVGNCKKISENEENVRFNEI